MKTRHVILHFQFPEDEVPCPVSFRMDGVLLAINCSCRGRGSRRDYGCKHVEAVAREDFSFVTDRSEQAAVALVRAWLHAKGLDVSVQGVCLTGGPAAVSKVDVGKLTGYPVVGPPDVHEVLVDILKNWRKKRRGKT